jgi:trk system potassium uptake protein TrkA
MKQYLVVGLGRFGSSIAKTLYEADEDVLAIDMDEDIVQDAINNDIVDNAVALDATDEKAMAQLGVEHFDVAFVCMGSNIQASIIITLLLKEMGIPKLICKAIKKSHGKVLRKIGADEVIYPEEYMGRRIALAAMEPNVIEHIRFSKDFLLVEIKAPAIFENKSLLELNIRNNYNVNVVGVKREDGTLNANPTANTVVRSGDVLIVVTDAKTAHTLENLK